ARLPAGARRLSRYLRPCADADEPGLRRVHAGLWRGRAESAAAGAPDPPRAALLVHRRVRLDRDAGGVADLRLGHPLLGRRIGLLPGGLAPAPAALRPAPRHADAVPHRPLSGDLLRY